jgi:hypothetical protein
MPTSPRTLRRIVRILLPPLVAAAASACGGDGPPTGSGGDVTVTLSPGTLTLHAYQEAQLDATVRRGGTAVTAKVTWRSSDTTVAVVLATGVVRARVPGSATITASGGGATATAEVTVAPDLNPGEFRAPFAGEWRNTTAFDHDIPRQFQPHFDNGYLLTFWGERLADIDGHNGYDWGLPVGTPVLAAGPGTVSFAGAESPFFCPLLNATVSGLWVDVAHGVAPHELVYTQYGHFSRIDVRPGDRVAAGQQLGLSGTTGCSTGPHLHFSVFRTRKDGRAVAMDPYGWHAAGSDPWAADSAGIASLDAWGAAPLLFRQVSQDPALLGGASPSITAVRYMGGDDAHNPNNEFVDVAVNPQVAQAELGGYTLRNPAGERFTFPPGTRVAGGTPVRVYSGTGTNTPTTLYWGRTTPAWSNVSGCAVLDDASGQPLVGVVWRGGSCPASARAPSLILAAPHPLDAPSPHAAELHRPTPFPR